MIEVLEATSDPRAFNALVDTVYERDPYHYARRNRPVGAAEGRRLFLAQEDGDAVARVSAQLSPLRDESGAPYGMLGHFEAHDRQDAARALLDCATTFLGDEGARVVLGPIDGDTWHRYRVNVGPFDTKPFLLEPCNPPYYAALWERAGFEPLEWYYSKRVDDLEPLVAAFEPHHAQAIAAGYRLREISMDDYDRDLERLYTLSCEIFAHNFLYTDIAYTEFRELYAGLRRLLVPDLVWFAHAPDGSAVGFLLAFPDHFEAVSSMRGETGLLARLRFLWHRRATGAVNIKTIGVLRRHRRVRLAQAMTYRAYRAAIGRGLRKANLCLIRQGNPSTHLDGGQGTIFRRYVLYQRKA